MKWGVLHVEGIRLMTTDHKNVVGGDPSWRI